MIRCRATVTGYWVHAVAVSAIGFALLQQWWEIWDLRAATEWTFHGLLMMLAGPVGLNLMAHLLFPEPMRGANLREYYYGAMQPVWWLGAITVVLATMFRPLIFGATLLSPDNATSILFFFGFITLAISKRSILHEIFVPTFLLLVLFDIFQWTHIIGPD